MPDELLVVAEAETDDERPARRYEIGYLLVPTLATSTVADTVETLLRVPIAKASGQIIDGEESKLIPIMYPIRKIIDNKNFRFKEAHFGSLQFSLPPAKVIELDQVFRASPLMLRFLIIELPTQVEEPRRRLKVDEVLPSPAMSQVDIDREIDSLLAPTV